ncbi:hypothetical protein [Filimonas effusa]|uniref:Uncharacterized protein n=1 Tax=Filimonas effusa TaxID=2508721 RepID=A0A4Q1DEA3_9BACT|nr:hypothetical protein [Filimonas effusa]RXK87023.1 hypothetical protein ESB13_09635 [Filimonas effusa]
MAKIFLLVAIIHEKVHTEISAENQLWLLGNATGVALYKINYPIGMATAKSRHFDQMLRFFYYPLCSLFNIKWQCPEMGKHIFCLYNDSGIRDNVIELVRH